MNSSHDTRCTRHQLVMDELLYSSCARGTGRLADRLWQLLAGGVLNVLLLVVVRRDLDEPLGLDLDNLPHELLGSEDELVIDHPPVG